MYVVLRIQFLVGMPKIIKTAAAARNETSRAKGNV